MPKVSIITPCYNSAKYLENTFRAVTSQSFKDWEWLVIDDCSNDESHSIIESWPKLDQRIKVFRNERNSGASPTRNLGLDQAAGEYVAFLDADDVWQEEKLEQQVLFMEKNPVDFTYHNYNMINFCGGFLKAMKSPKKITKSTLEQFNPIFTSSVMMRKSSIGDTRFKKELRRRQDYIFWFQVISKTVSAVNVELNLGSYRIGNTNSLSHNKFRTIPIQWNIYRKEFHLSLFQSIQSLVAYAFHGIKKYFL